MKYWSHCENLDETREKIEKFTVFLFFNLVKRSSFSLKHRYFRNLYIFMQQLSAQFFFVPKYTMKLITWMFSVHFDRHTCYETVNNFADSAEPL